MPTTYRIVPEGTSIDLDLDRFQATLPASMQLDQRSDGLYVAIDSVEQEDETTQPFIERELDRVFFLTCVRLRAEMCRRTVTSTLQFSYRIHGRLPGCKGPQDWTDTLALQLKLWSLAANATDFTLRVLLYFQIIELSYPQTNDKNAYPFYEDESKSPHPRTEAKLLRHLVVHAGEPRSETERYLRHLGLPPVLSNLTHPQWRDVVDKRLQFVESQAREILNSAV
ncbi:MAG: hypothetical protein LLH30_09980 [Candidatus Manganitrophus sp. SA1]|nr:hypothetical protein [Candidatus Manganitrophus morganii]